MAPSTKSGPVQAGRLKHQIAGMPGRAERVQDRAVAVEVHRRVRHALCYGRAQAVTQGLEGRRPENVHLDPRHHAQCPPQLIRDRPVPDVVHSTRPADQQQHPPHGALRGFLSHLADRPHEARRPYHHRFLHLGVGKQLPRDGRVVHVVADLHP